MAPSPQGSASQAIMRSVRPSMSDPPVENRVAAAPPPDGDLVQAVEPDAPRGPGEGPAALAGGGTDGLAGPGWQREAHDQPLVGEAAGSSNGVSGLASNGGAGILSTAIG